MNKKNWQYGKRSVGDSFFDCFNSAVLFLLALVTIYPFIYVFFASVSDPVRLMAHIGPLVKPLGFQLKGYELVLGNAAIRNGYMVTLFVVVFGTLCSMIVSLLFAYVLSRRNLMLHGLITFLAVFTMYFSGGMIPLFLVVRGLGLLDSLWSLIIPGLVSTYNVIILRTAFNAIPNEMEESAKLDGAGNIRIMVVILIPLIMPTIAAITLFYMVGYWNAWASAVIYIKTPTKYPLQLVLRSLILLDETTEAAGGSDVAYAMSLDYGLRQLLKYCTMIATIVPIICVYPVLQRYFTKGIMIGAIKG
jgi:putative aldouronate transport system permease protein